MGESWILYVYSTNDRNWELKSWKLCRAKVVIIQLKSPKGKLNTITDYNLKECNIAMDTKGTVSWCAS